MLLYPSVDKLLERIDSRYKIIALASARARELEGDSTVDPAVKPAPTIENFQSVKTIGQALEEIEAGNVVIDPSEKNPI